MPSDTPFDNLSCMVSHDPSTIILILSNFSGLFYMRTLWSLRMDKCLAEGAGGDPFVPHGAQMVSVPSHGLIPWGFVDKILL